MSDPAESADPEITRVSLWILRIVSVVVVGITMFFLIDAIVG